MACLRLLTLRPDRPLFNVPALRFFIARSTLAAAFFEYFRAMSCHDTSPGCGKIIFAGADGSRSGICRAVRRSPNKARRRSSRPQPREGLRRSQCPRHQRQRAERFVFGRRGQQENEHDVHRLAVDGVEFDRRLQFREQPVGPLQFRQPGMRDGDALADPRRSQVFALEQIGRDLIGGRPRLAAALAANSCSSSRLPEARTSIMTSDRRQQIGDFHGRSARTHRYEH